MAVQHHHAHIVSCLAENRVKGPVIGLSLDGTGLGLDRQIWGGEVLLADLTSFQRAGHLEYIPLPGGDGAVRFPWRTGLSYLHHVFGKDLFGLSLPFIREIDRQEAAIICRMIEKRVNTPLTSSCGRLFDAISAIIGLRKRIAFEGQAAMELEMTQAPDEEGSYPWDTEKKDRRLILCTAPLIRGVVEDLEKGVGREIISSRFHNTLVDLFTGACLVLKERTGIQAVALSGGVFQNVTLQTGLLQSLTRHGFQVYSHTLVPANDGGIALGQAVCAGMKQSGMQGQYDA
jgi:hydrogenase maturation protein HypF